MIVTELKPLEEVVDMLSSRKKVLILGCERCATSCETGGEKQVAEMEEVLSEKGYAVSSGMVEAQCDERLSKLELKKHSDFDCVLSMSCGSGAYAVSNLTDNPVFPSNNTLFLGVRKPGRRFEESCSLCGECLLAETGGICPVTRCSKSLLHGPCGGSSKGKCEAEDDRDCAWSEIIERLKGQGRENELDLVRKPRKNMQRSRPRSLKR